MDDPPRPKRLYILWFVAAALAFAAVAIELFKQQSVNWPAAVIGGVCVLMGWLNMTRKTGQPPGS